ncbi:UDP-N-acetylglucosamine pyrophosphorylase [Clostridium sp. C2-6-12]|uniref:UDP-N-acetylglucosamine pyrophosphorylase n=1 Tax=Clostridium sp. C2-6-12 TaxID=2698832 RepID=UPI00136B64EF|nr:UDP-N-acetylglucosamine pyrophosphorylase [Clostridium sp. C2-6-12]
MRLELDIYELGEVLRKIEAKYKLNVLIKAELSGGWMTITGVATVSKAPTNKGNGGCCKKDNIIDIKVTSEANEDGFVVKLTGSQNKKFNIDISSTRYKEVLSSKLKQNPIKINENESKLRIDEDIIFTIGASVDEISEIIKN